MKSPRTMAIPALVGLAVVLLLMTAAGCNAFAPPSTSDAQPVSPIPVGTPIPFTLFHQDFDNGNDGILRTPEAAFKPQIVLIESAKDVEAIAYRLQPDAEEALAQIDYGRMVALIIFMGGQGTPGFGIETQGLYQAGQTLNVYADFWEPDCSGGCPSEMSSPYQIVVFSRSDLSTAQSQLSPHLIATTYIPTPAFPPR